MPHRPRPAILALALLATHPARAETTCQLARAADLPMQISHGKLLVQGKINGVSANFIFDTGSATTMIADSSVYRLNLRPVRDEGHGLGALGRAEGIGGARTVRAVQAHAIDLGGLRARDFAFLAIDRNFDFTNPAADGLLSADLIAKYDIDLDLIGNRIVLYYPVGDCSQPAAYMHGPLYQTPLLAGSRDRSPRVTVTINNHDLNATIDTGAPRTVILRDAAAAVGIDTSKLATSRVMVGGIGEGKSHALPFIAPSLAIGDIEFHNMPIGVVDEVMGDEISHTDMLLGLDFLTRVHAWLSFSSNTLIMQYPPKPSPPP